MAADSFSLYVHVPFCRDGKCPYCDFYSVPARDSLIADYLDALERETGFSACFWPERGSRVETVFFGGGTPSLLSAEHLGFILEKVAAVWGIDSTAEISLEANPEDVNEASAAAWLGIGVNRLSVGCQSFDDTVLAALGRRHDAARGRGALESARRAGFERLSADFIFGGPGCSAGSLTESLSVAIGLGVDHLSIYGYHLEETCLVHARPEFAGCGENEYGAQYLAACECLSECGWNHYELSNWARDTSRVCRHNLAYWTGKPYLGLGPSAHSFQPPDRRFWNRGDLKEYIECGWRAGTALSCREGEFLSARQRLSENLMLGLRLEDGAPVSLVGQILGRRTAEVLRDLDDSGLLYLKNSRVRLTDRGFLVLDCLVDRILSQGEFPLDK